MDDAYSTPAEKLKEMILRACSTALQIKFVGRSGRAISCAGA